MAVPSASPAAVIYSGIRNLTTSSLDPANVDGLIEVRVDSGPSVDLQLFLGGRIAFASAAGGVLNDAQNSYLLPLAPGQFVGPADAPWIGKLGILAGVSTPELTVAGPWAPPHQTGIFGFAFLGSASETHYGWARANLQFNPPNGSSSATLIDWAYEDQANTAIQAPIPEPSTLSLLALGAAGLAALRARRRQA
ncbi:MAG TPA: PEP-CTERM sorting domain-containing protein [Paludibaculum sp.]